MTKTDNGLEFPAEAYAYVPDAAEPSTWKIRLWAAPETKVTRAQLGAAAAALSPGGFRGEKADIPEGDLGRVKARIRAGYKSLDVKPEDMPESVRASEHLFMVSLSTPEADKPIRMAIAMTGTFHKGKQKFSITRADVATMAANFRKRGNGEVVIDYEHAAEQPEVAMGGPVPAAGWIVSIDPEPDADHIVWGEAKFNARAAEMIAAGEYKYGSPNLVWGYRDKSTGESQGLTLTSFALTNTPVLDRMPAIRLSDAGWSELTINEGERTSMAKEPVMCSEHPKTPMLCPKCDADEMKTLTASEHTHQGPKVIRLSEVKRDANGAINLAALGNDEVVSGEVFRAYEQERVALSEVQSAINTGRIKPADRDLWTKIALSNVTSFQALTKDTKAVDLGEHGHAGAGSTESMTELEQIENQLQVRASEIAKADNKPFHEAMKIAGSEKPDLIRRRRVIRLGLSGISYKTFAGVIPEGLEGGKLN